MTHLQKFNLPSATKQSGVVLFITLVSLVIMLIASVALIRSTDTNLLISGSLAFKRDVVNQAERSMPSIRAKFTTGALSVSTAKQADSVAVDNYYATILPSNASGVPNVLLNTSTFDTAMPSNNITYASGGITIRYVIDRMCLAAGAISPSNCTISKAGTDLGGGAIEILGKLTGEDGVVYRISLRATGPKNTEAFMQSTFTI
jgi:type IV pilus assembly protein PilX